MLENLKYALNDSINCFENKIVKKSPQNRKRSKIKSRKIQKLKSYI